MTVEVGRGNAPGALEAASRGEILLFRAALEELGWQARFEELLSRAVEAVAGVAVARALRRSGVERLHEQVSPDQVLALNERLMRVVPPLMRRFVKDLVRRKIASRRGLRIWSKTIVRFIVPHDAWEPRYGKLPGRLKILGPHRDSWFDLPENSLNVWIAMGRVSNGNSLLIFPGVWGAPLERQDRDLARTQRLPAPERFELSAGDLLLFAGEHLHASELNVTAETRVVFSTRLVLGAPVFAGEPDWDLWFPSSWMGSPLEPLAALPALASLHYLRLVRRSVRRLLRRRSRAVPGRAPPRVAPAPLRGEDVPLGAIRPLSPGRCVLRTERGLVTFQRACPHEGADLALGRYEDGQIRCPWHNLGFDARSGQHACRRLAHLRMFPVRARQDGVLLGEDA